MTVPEIHPKGWGHEKWIVNKPEYCGKVLVFEKGKRCSWHYHAKKDEVFYLHSGAMTVFYGWTDDIMKSDSIMMTPGDTFHVPIGMRHQMHAEEASELFEFSTQHFEDDSFRVIKGD